MVVLLDSNFEYCVGGRPSAWKECVCMCVRAHVFGGREGAGSGNVAWRMRC